MPMEKDIFRIWGLDQMEVNIRDLSRRNFPPVKSGMDFVGFVQGELIGRCRANPQYSLRAFARKLDIEPSALSKILNKKRQISPKMFERISNALSVPPDKHFSFQNSIVQQRSKKNNGKYDPFFESEYQKLALETFRVVSDWCHYAILELVEVKGFKSDYQWVSRKLGISRAEAVDAVDRLHRLGFLKTTQDGQWINQHGNNTTVGNKFTDSAFRKLQSQLLLQAQRALEELPIDVRDQTSMTMAIDQKDLSAAKDKIKKFRRQFCRSLQKKKDKTHVYQLSISFFPVSK